MRRRGAAATARDIQQTLIRQIAQRLRRVDRPLVVARFRQRIGQAGVRITMHKRIRDARKLADVRRHFLGTERAVDAHGEGLRVRDGIPKRLGRLPRKRAAGGIGDGHRNHHRQSLAGIFENLFNCKQSRLEVERVKRRLRQQNIHAAFD